MSDVKGHLEQDRDFLKEFLRELMEEALEQQMDETLCAQKGERTSARIGYRSGSYSRTLITRVGKLELRIPQDRHEEIKRRTHVVRIFPNEQSCLRLVRALAIETHENWIEVHRYLDMNLLK